MASECILVPCYKRLSRAVSIACLLGFLVPLSILSNTLSALPLDSQKNIQLPQIYTIEVVNVYPHDPRAFTEGLLYGGNNTLYESTGLYGMVEALQTMDLSYFGEGLTLVDERLYQLTYEHNTGFIHDRSNLSKVRNSGNPFLFCWNLSFEHSCSPTGHFCLDLDLSRVGMLQEDELIDFYTLQSPCYSR
ncbi:glutaminyl-peptide cyclotransferase isoform X2 [Beta vulgaris subsp. vulgaris]|uniref:glutaminyl-peptide cyclotransferase isoform X2 n=1 Tax=Beta vulgaris subsp. vulgaris TaxID=3555 RepID=UPI0020368C28|nr:glutaminyl-peptide cyclotransferase isoform X2 [Beta vulgaris subsp. vulgaris]